MIKSQETDLSCLQCMSYLRTPVASTEGMVLSALFLLQIDTFGKWLRCLTNVCYVNTKKNQISGQTQIILVHLDIWSHLYHENWPKWKVLSLFWYSTPRALKIEFPLKMCEQIWKLMVNNLSVRLQSIFLCFGDLVNFEKYVRGLIPPSIAQWHLFAHNKFLSWDIYWQEGKP